MLLRSDGINPVLSMKFERRDQGTSASGLVNLQVDLREAIVGLFGRCFIGVGYVCMS